MLNAERKEITFHDIVTGNSFYPCSSVQCGQLTVPDQVWGIFLRLTVSFKFFISSIEYPSPRFLREQYSFPYEYKTEYKTAPIVAGNIGYHITILLCAVDTGCITKLRHL